MQVFTPYPEPYKTACCLDPKRLNKQIIECRQILFAIYGKSKGWKNHPVTKQYTPHEIYLQKYLLCLMAYKEGRIYDAQTHSHYAMLYKPAFLTKAFCDQHKRRLYTKDKEFYKQFEAYGTSEENWYYVDGELLKYNRGKKNSEKKSDISL